MVVSPNLLCSGNSCASKGLRSLGSVFLLPFVILVQKQHFNIKLLTSPSYSSLQTSYPTPHQTPHFTSNSTLHIKLHASHQTPRSLHTTPIKLATTLHHQTTPQPTSTVWTRYPRDGWRSGKVSRAELPPKQCHGASSAGVPAKRAKGGRTLPIVSDSSGRLSPWYFLSGCKK